MNIIDEILTRKEFKEDPPVLLDIGSSSHLVEDWKDIAKYSICIAFDADKRDIEYIIEENKKYKKLYIYNCIVTDKDSGKRDFFLTKSPYCSSSLEPDTKALSNYAFYGLFAIEKRVNLKAMNLKTVLGNLRIKKIDWFKTDSQGTDLRLFDTLDKSMKKRVLVADFEPGIIDAYKGEDKLADLLFYMDKLPFWVSKMHVCGSYRFNTKILSERLSKSQIETLARCSKTAPTCAEITYMNSFLDDEHFNKRDYLMMCVFALINEQNGFALEIAIKGKWKFQDAIFTELENYILTLINDTKLKLKQDEALELKRQKYLMLFRLYTVFKRAVKRLMAMQFEKNKNA